MSRSRDWVLRCVHEVTQHEDVCWCTLTYADKYLPPTLVKRDVSGFLKRLRKRIRKEDGRSRRRAVQEGRALPPFRKVRFLAVGEYGEQFGRPHYHVILFGVHHADPAIGRSWTKGIVDADSLTPARIAYAAGYAWKKVDRRELREERVDLTTGEVFLYQPEFRVMSKKPGLGSYARDVQPKLWRDHAVLDGKRIPVPRYYHNAYKAIASPEELAALQQEKLARPRPTREQLEAQAEIDRAKVRQHAERRRHF